MIKIFQDIQNILKDKINEIHRKEKQVIDQENERKRMIEIKAQKKLAEDQQKELHKKQRLREEERIRDEEKLRRLAIEIEMEERREYERRKSKRQEIKSMQRHHKIMLSLKMKNQDTEIKYLKKKLDYPSYICKILCDLEIRDNNWYSQHRHLPFFGGLRLN